MRTEIGDGNLFMACSHVAHDCRIGSYNIFANCALLAGHVTIGDHAILGGLCGVHQFVRIGDYVMLSGGSMANKDVPPYCTAQGDRAGLVGINTIGLQRHGFSRDDIKTIRKLYRDLFYGDGLFEERHQAVREQYADKPVVQPFLDFLKGSERGFLPTRGNADSDAE